ncbi:helix-turn-helix transcriptional regulator [Microtetraspora fusca]|uniref:Helix-turn-helix transcriptional regulator n=1 Tax=Microtetraspora fusca TaxID=1997 RepID=A0ABW6VHY6_MICFU|nr:helix-turn-helix transcriptional regulator [Microtetraspora fusca]
MFGLLMNDMNRGELADFLRRSRGRLRPLDVGLPEGPRRRTPGLRREEIAQLSGMSFDYYMRLEQARSPQPSTQMLAALARALRLGDDERDHLYLLSGHRPPAARPAGEEISPGVRHLLDRLRDTPVQVVSDLGYLLTQNAKAEALFDPVCKVDGEDRNIVWAWFTNPRLREPYTAEEWEQGSRRHVADLRVTVARRGGDAASTNLVQRLLARSDEFAELWALHEVRVNRNRRIRMHRPGIGTIEFDVETLLTPADDQRLLIYTAPSQRPSRTRIFSAGGNKG